MTWWLFSSACGIAYWRGSWRWLIGLGIIWGAWVLHLNEWWLRAVQRWDTYAITIQLSRQHPLIGVGAGPVALPTLCRLSGMPLPGPHSDWLSLALLHGWPVVLMTLGLLMWLLWPRRAYLDLAVQALLLTLAIAASGRAVVVHPGYVMAVTVCSLYLVVTKEQA